MDRGRNVQLTKQIGEYLVASELARRGYIASTFSGNIPEYDIVGIDKNGFTKLVQVKTINQGSWQFAINRFVNITMEGNKQIVGDLIPQPIDNLICIFVYLGKKYGEDKFYIIKWSDLQKLIVDVHKKYLQKNNGERPRAKTSLHFGLIENNIIKYINKWENLD